MRISVRQSGGFAGIDVELGSVDTASLAAAEADGIAEVLRRAGFDQLPENVPGAAGADFLRYDITLENQGRSRRVAFADDASEGSRRLLEVLETLRPHLRLGN